MILEIEKMVSVIISLYNIEKVKKLERTLKEKEGNMELARKDIKMTQGLAILTMVSLHLFCRLGTDVYGTPLLWLNSTTPAVYIMGWLSEICIPLYSICSGYAHYKLGGEWWIKQETNLQ